MRVALLLGSVLLLSTGCAAQVPRVDGAAGPITAPSASAAAPSGPAAPPSGPAAEPTSPASASSRPDAGSSSGRALVLGPDGLGALKLGMTSEQATATRLITRWEGEGTEGCTLRSSLRAANDAVVLYSGETGIAVIEAYGDIRTPQGIREGSTTAAMRKAYPRWQSNNEDGEKYGDGHGLVTVPGNSAADYRIAVENGRVTELTLQLKTQPCYE
jgi:hypothetical protein